MSSFLGPITVQTVLYVFVFRTLPSFMVFAVPPFFVAMLDLRLEDVDFSLAFCVDGASRCEYYKLDKLFDLLFIMIMGAFSFSQHQQHKGELEWRWVPINLVLAAYRAVGIGLILITSANWLNVLFPNVWLPYFWFFTFLQYTRTYAWARRTTWFWYLFMILIPVYKLTEEVLHFTTKECWEDDASPLCTIYSEGASTSAVLRNFSHYFLLPVFLALFVRHQVDLRQQHR
jgi:hypothetical protein